MCQTPPPLLLDCKSQRTYRTTCFLALCVCLLFGGGCGRGGGCPLFRASDEEEALSLSHTHALSLSLSIPLSWIQLTSSTGLIRCSAGGWGGSARVWLARVPALNQLLRVVCSDSGVTFFGSFVFVVWAPPRGNKYLQVSCSARTPVNGGCPRRGLLSWGYHQR